MSVRLPPRPPAPFHADPLVNLNHFRLLRVVGKGAFGKVRIVERKETGLAFALKYIRKEEGAYPGPSPISRSDLLQSSAPKVFATSSVSVACSNT